MVYREKCSEPVLLQYLFLMLRYIYVYTLLHIILFTLYYYMCLCQANTHHDVLLSCLYCKLYILYTEMPRIVVSENVINL